MRKRFHSVPIIFILVLILFLATRQFLADFYYRMAQHDWHELDRVTGYLEKCVAIDSRSSLFHFSLGRAYLRKGLAEAAKRGEKNKWARKSIDEFHRAIELEPSNSDYHFHLGNSYIFLAYPPQFYCDLIQNSFERAIMLNPTHTGRLYSVGVYYLRESDLLRKTGQNVGDISSFDYEKYVAMSRENYQFYFRKLLNTNGEYLGKVLTTCYSVSQEYPDLRGVIRDASSDHAFLAGFLNRNGMWEPAKVEFQKSIELEPNNPSRYSDFARALFERGEYENAIYWWQKQKVLTPRDDGPYLFAANGFMKLKRFDDALRELRSLIAVNPENIAYRARLIRTLLAVHRFDEAIEEYCKMVEGEPHPARTTCNTIQHHRKRGDHKEVARIINEGLSSVLQR